jgi:gliding motility-associated-like protein
MAKMYFSKIGIVLMAVLLCTNVSAQKMPLNKVSQLYRVANSQSSGNQDCITAKPICTSAAFSDNSTGKGNVDDLNSINEECLYYPTKPPEHYSSWYYFDIVTPGTLNFEITPDSLIDFDFLVWGPNIPCPVNVAPTRCNASGQIGKTGLSSTAVNTTEPSTGSPYCKELTVLAGERYILMIDNFNMSTKGFGITFGGSATLDCNIVKATVQASSDTICPNNAVSLTVKSAQTFTWTTLADSATVLSTTKDLSVTPSVTTTYMVKGMNDAAKPYRVLKTIFVRTAPNVVATATATSICIGSSTTITASGANSYNWALQQNPNNPFSFNTIITVSSIVNTTYDLTGTDSYGCIGKSIVGINIWALPNITLTGTSTICRGDSTVLHVTGASTYAWSTVKNGSVVATGANVTFKPVATTTYYVTATDANGCTNQDSLLVRVNNLPVISVGASPQVICRNGISVLQGYGGVSYQWYIAGNPSLQSTANPYNVSPANSETYNVIGTDNNGCKNNFIISVIVNQLPTVAAFTSLDSVCAGGSAQLTGNGATSYTWATAANPAITLASTRKYTVSPPTTTTYIVEGTDNNSCKNTATITLAVNQLPNIYITASDDSICPGTTTRLDPKNGINYFWYNATAPTIPISNDNPYFVSPATTTTYNITGTDVHGCVNTNSKQVYVFAFPQTQAIKGSPYVCPSSSGVSYVVPGGKATSTYKWTVNRTASIISSTQGNDTIKVNFAQADTITMTVRETDKNGCLGNLLTYKVIVIANYTPPAAIGNDTLCSKDKNSVVYSAPNGSSDFTYQWYVNNGSVVSGNGTPNVVVKWNNIGSPAGSIYYIQQSTTANPACFFTSSTLSVTIYPSPVANVVKGDQSVCKGGKGILYELSGDAGSSYFWKINGGRIIGGNTKSFVTVDWDSTMAQTLKVLETSDKGCPGDTVKIIVFVNPLPVAGPINGTFIICPSNITGQNYTTTGLAGSRFVWSVLGGTIKSGNGTNSIVIDWSFNIKNPLITVIEISKDSCIGSAMQHAVVQDETSAQFVVVTTNEKNDKEIDLLWNRNNRQNTLNTYDLYKRNFGVNAPWFKIANQIVENNYTDKNVSTYNTIYEYQYTIVDLCNNVSTSLANNSILLGANGVETSKVVNLRWNQYNNWSRGLNRYEVWRRLDDEPAFTFYANVTKPDTAISFTNGLDGFKQKYKIKAVENFTENIAWSNDTTITFANKVQIPNSYSPNGDGVNDRWEIKDIEPYPNTSLEVFDRAGALVYKNANYKNEWDGRAVSGKELADGTYYYILKLGGKGAFGIDSFSGNVTIIR